MADVKPLVFNSGGDIKELGVNDTLVFPLLSSAPVSNPPTGYVYVYGLTTDKSIYQKDSLGSITIITGGAGSGGGLTHPQVMSRVSLMY